MTVRAKVYVSSIEGGVIKLEAVGPGPGTSDENAQFFEATPHLQLEMGTTNPEAAVQFETGQEFYLDFTPVEPPVPAAGNGDDSLQSNASPDPAPEGETAEADEEGS